MARTNTENATERVYHIHLALSGSSSLCHGLLEGFSAYGGHRLDWRCGILPSAAGQAAGPPHTDALVGIVKEDMAEAWDLDQRRRVINISRSRDLPNIASVTCDDVLIGRMAADHLLSKNLQTFAYIGAASNREQAFAERIAEHNRPYQSFVAPQTSKNEVRHWLARLPKRTGIMTFNDNEAVKLLWAAQEAGRAVPEDLAVVGADADHVQSLLSPVPITSVDPDFFTVGYRAAELLDRILQEGYDARSERIRIPPAGIVKQASSDLAGIEDPFVVQSARFIRQHACEGISAGDVVNAMPLSRRPLERRFRRIFNRTLLEEIRRVQITEAANLLARTRFPISEVARQSGFKSHARLTQLFTKFIGISPAAYRRKHGQSL